MNTDFYLSKFKNAADLLDKKLMAERQLETAVGVVLDSVALKVYKPAWASDKVNPLNAKSRIFFSVWVNDKTIEQGNLFYNIHALKLRGLKGYSIASREFADKFRSDFKKHQGDWANVTVDFGPLTLMEGWNELQNERVEKTIIKLVNNFFKIEHLIDKTLKVFENRK